MASIAGLVIADVLGSRRGIQDSDALNRIRIIGAVVGASPLGIIVSDFVAQREAQSTVVAQTTTTTSTTTQTMVQVPRVTDMVYDSAEKLLQLSYGLRAQRQDVIGSTIAKDVVISQNPSVGTFVPTGTTVTLGVSLGVVVPDVRNLLLTDATIQLQAIGLQVQPVNERSSTVPQDAVIRQDPAAGSNVSPGSTVTLTVSLGGNVTVPNVVDVRVADAQAQLQAAGLQTRLAYETSGGVNKGFVIKSDPLAGTSVSLGTTITLTISTGQDFEIPDVTGQLFRDAQKKLQALKLQVKQEDQNSDAVREGFVIRQDPPAKTSVSPNSVVTLFVSKGVPAVELPNLIGQRFSKARETLQDLDFIVRHEEVDSAERKGTVVDQNPKAGKVAPESQVTLFVSKGRQELEFPQEPT
jgi:beta-lactam-binding protein with PASTA domain